MPPEGSLPGRIGASDVRVQTQPKASRWRILSGKVYSPVWFIRMTIMSSSNLAIFDGIKAAGIGKKGSKSLTPELIQAIVRELREGRVPAVVKGAFFGGLIIKGVMPEEKVLEQAIAPGISGDFSRLVSCLAGDAPALIQKLCVRLLRQETLDEETAKVLGDFLFSMVPGDGARGMAAAIMRVRHETPEEYTGILRSIQETIEPSFREEVPPGEPVFQIAEPFDGVDHSCLITPLILQYFQKRRYRAVGLVGRNSGPKLGNNLLDLVDAVGGTFLRGNTELRDKKPDLGWYIRQQDMSAAMDRWVALRRQIIKRPFLSTLERFVNPAKADILIASAFHPPYGEKMTTVAEKAGYPGIVIVRNGLEGTLAFALKRDVKILCSARQTNGQYLRHEIELNAEEYLNVSVEVEEKFEQPSLEENARLIKEYARQGRTDYRLFDWRVRATCAGLEQAVEWIENSRK